MSNLVVESFVLEYTLPQMINIEMARHILLDEFSIHPSASLMRSDSFVHLVRRKLFEENGPTHEGFSFAPDLNEVKAKITTNEAVQSLQTDGALIGADSLVVGNMSVRYISSRGDSASFLISLPSVYSAYRIAAAFRGELFRLASGDIYLSQLDRAQLPPRVRRCIDECISAFRHGLYLSATMNVGAASEGLWMELGILVHKNINATEGLTRAFKKTHTSIADVIEEAWNALRNHAKDQLNSVFTDGTQQRLFKEHADRLRDRRNYALHIKDADEDASLFQGVRPPLRATHVERDRQRCGPRP